VRLGGILQTTDPKVAAERDRRFLEGGKEEMVNLAPALGPGAHAGAAPAGEIHPQPRLADGRRLDAAIGGYRFALLGPGKFLDEVGNGIPRIEIDSEKAVLLRPDRYIAGTATSAAGARQLVERFAA
jgi:3-(3-hydroxy-phenyl)propionate hydroxylase